MSTDKQQTAIQAKAQEQAILSMIQQVPAFSRLPSKYIQFIRKAAKPRPVAAGEVLCEQGGEPAGLFILVKGSLSRRREGSEVGTLTAPTSAGEGPVLTGDPHPEEIAALEDGVVLHIPHQLMAAAVAKELELFQRLSRNVIGVLAGELMTANAGHSDLAVQRAELLELIQAAELDLNDARMIHSMHGSDDE